ncbi:matrixin family metalloprotease, partial [Nostoc sp. CHAB 5836]|uniref:matrixin family metalloprotease n=1 Tax=Nostoc sp. CHAB 5836 TaxID=2780404 RepID=UPI001E56DCC9
MSGINELFGISDSMVVNDGAIMAGIEDPLKLSQGIGIYPNNSPNVLVGSPSTDLLIIDNSLSSTSFGEQPFTNTVTLLFKPNSSNTSTTSFDLLTGTTSDDPLVGFWSQEEVPQSLLSISPKTEQSDIRKQPDQLLGTINVPNDTKNRQSLKQLTPEILERFRSEAIARWASVGITPGEQGILKEVQLAIADLPSLKLGLTNGNVITLDQDAAGIGWFIDPTPDDDSEFNPIENSPGEGKVDLLTAIAHEMGHVLGLSHVDYGTSVMSATLPIGVRRLPTWEDIHFTDETSPELAELNLDTNSSSIVYWVGGSGYWDDLTHWSTGRLPGATDEVVIDVPQEVMITFRQGSTSIAKLTIEEDLVISGGSLTILGEGAINNDLILNSGALNTTGTVTLKGQNNQWYTGVISGPGIVNIAAEATLNINDGGNYK